MSNFKTYYINSQGEAFGVAAIEKTVKHHINHKMAEEKTCAYGTIYEDPSEYQLFLRRDAKISENDWSLYWKGGKYMLI